MNKPNEIVYALRCISSVDNHECKKNECPYFIAEPEETIRKFREEHPEADAPDDFFEGCDYDAISQDAADCIEGFYKELEQLIKTLAGGKE